MSHLLDSKIIYQYVFIENSEITKNMKRILDRRNKIKLLLEQNL